jgi:hypothetical protein
MSEWLLVAFTATLAHATYSSLPDDRRPSLSHILTHLLRVSVTIRDCGHLIIFRAWGIIRHNGRWVRWQYSALRWRSRRYVGRHERPANVTGREGASNHDADKVPASPRVASSR